MIQVPIKAIADSDEEGNPVHPEPGDTLDLGGVTVKVESIEGDTATVDVQTINGEPVTYAADSTDSPKPGTQEMHRHLRSQFRKMGKEND